MSDTRTTAPKQPHRIAVLVFDGADPLGEYVMTVRAEHEQAAVDRLRAALRPDLSYQFFALNRVVVPSC